MTRGPRLSGTASRETSREADRLGLNSIVIRFEDPDIVSRPVSFSFIFHFSDGKSWRNGFLKKLFPTAPFVG